MVHFFLHIIEFAHWDLHLKRVIFGIEYFLFYFSDISVMSIILLSKFCKTTLFRVYQLLHKISYQKFQLGKCFICPVNKSSNVASVSAMYSVQVLRKSRHQCLGIAGQYMAPIQILFTRMTNDVFHTI